MKPYGFSILALLVLLCSLCEFGFCREDTYIRMKLGDFDGSQNENALLEVLARFAVQEHNKQQNAFLEFGRVLKAREQVVAGKIYHLTLEAIDSGKKKIYEARVWVKPWMNFKQLEEFKFKHDVSSFGVKPDGHGTEWQPVPTDDTDVLDAANHAVKSLQLKSNSMVPYELREIILEVIEDYVEFELHLKVKRGIKEEIFRFRVNKNFDGEYAV